MNADKTDALATNPTTAYNLFNVPRPALKTATEKAKLVAGRPLTANGTSSHASRSQLLERFKTLRQNRQGQKSMSRIPSGVHFKKNQPSQDKTVSGNFVILPANTSSISLRQTLSKPRNLTSALSQQDSQRPPSAYQQCDVQHFPTPLVQR